MRKKVRTSQENVTDSEHSGTDTPLPDITTLADLLITLPDSDRTDIIAGLPQDQRVAVARLLVKRIQEQNDG